MTALLASVILGIREGLCDERPRLLRAVRAPLRRPPSPLAPPFVVGLGFRPRRPGRGPDTNLPEFLEAQFAIWPGGLVGVPINAKLHRSEFAYIIEHSGARIAFASPDLAETVGPLVDSIAGLERVIVAGSTEWRRLRDGAGIDLLAAGPDDSPWLFYISCTTARPQGAALTHRNLLVCA